MLSSERLVIDTTEQSWQPVSGAALLQEKVFQPQASSLSPTTRLLRYPSGGHSPHHSHPEGEEVLVLDGVFSDDRGDWPEGSLLLNPEDYSHRSFSEQGCLLLVRQRQYAGAKRHHLALNLARLPWETCVLTGIDRKQLYGQSCYPDWLELELWPSCCEPGLRVYQGGAELFVLSGVLEDDQGCYGAGSWLCFPPGGRHRPFSREGCELYIKQGSRWHQADAVM